VDRPLIRLLLVILALVLAVVWLLAGIVPFTAPWWMPPSSVIAVAVAMLL
jgi:hypothetical protein